MDSKILVKDGGFGTQIKYHTKQSVHGDSLWTARYNDIDPEAVLKTHFDFLRNGADIILTNTYQASVEGYVKNGFTKNEGFELIKESVRIAKKAVNQYKDYFEGLFDEIHIPLIMASIGPYGAYMHDGSEYNGNYADDVTEEKIKNWHRSRIIACLEEGVSGLAIETIPCQMEAEALIDLVLSDFKDVRFWVSFQCKDEKHLANGQNFAAVVSSIWNKIKKVDAVKQLYGIGINCVHPSFVEPLLLSVHNVLGNDLPPFVVYSNNGEVYDNIKCVWTGIENCKPLESYVSKWIELGVKIIGGCCRVNANDIAQIRKCVDDIKRSALNHNE